MLLLNNGFVGTEVLFNAILEILDANGLKAKWPFGSEDSFTGLVKLALRADPGITAADVGIADGTTEGLERWARGQASCTSQRSTGCWNRVDIDIE